ncbi:putative histone acetyltransferase HAC-like 1 [Nymphaea thermarum]|nr:putative histone acetyltransferase HAC-like 1 [Nymphaea thermarum]
MDGSTLVNSIGRLGQALGWVLDKPVRDLKEHLRRSQQQSDSRRRAAVMEMMRQRAAEVAANNA